MLQMPRFISTKPVVAMESMMANCVLLQSVYAVEPATIAVISSNRYWKRASDILRPELLKLEQ
ncbi:hypothetical protein F441_16844 [Phytophthora nicotianae CJ01A1]|uniref:Uncharacterized protein n=6 Tax=Phytophthora nicotianae TaxID=4792 RepID=W2P997_PHYN3|nr:hypothetical protein PPTG_25031 [Phytophthora nicotianae INRA-310]ETI51327.1 hypothetical protein F443_05310 [Phytophthora nicotianae P1569]ETL30645.1 hypothetical protein L916_16421 [Phytophthora nicotianae]ETO80077.1 hypothetical protein F444_05353 [Phytophthora nicotianae P1976]ETP06823.1 hypothetical protein F441_16844 [Phytophthora nicotianae CJ01A1]ETP49004.1 hypothetical protein F442_05355 [Phytophthora nicotianae P10297]